MSAVTALQLVNMLASGTRALEEHREEINALNVFPVPDGDTGTNMVLTAQGMAAALGNLVGTASSLRVEQVASTAAEASLVAARGNSGVIFSQFIRGLARALRGKGEASPLDLARAFQYGLVYAYQALAHPVEGTILTVAREAARAARGARHPERDLPDLLASAIAGGNEALARTPEQLPALKQAGVVDAGGYGLLLFLEGCLGGLTGEAVNLSRVAPRSRPAAAPAAAVAALTYTYCTEAMVRGAGLQAAAIRTKLGPLGDSLVVVPAANAVKVHVHTNRPGLVLETLAEMGTLHEIKIDNMADQHRESPWAELTGPALVAVAPGDGWAELFTRLGANRVIPGGDTMNPSVQQFLEALRGTATAFVFPNNPNVRLAAEQAASLTGATVFVLPTADPPQGLAALFAYKPDADPEINLERMRAALQRVKTARITYAVRDSAWEGEELPAGTILGLAAGRLVATGTALGPVVSRVVGVLLAEAPGAELLTLFRGAPATEEEAVAVAAALGASFPGLEIELKCGGQPNDYFLLMLE